MRRFGIAALLLVFAALCAPAFGGKKPKGPFFESRAGSDKIADIELVRAAQACNNWSWAAAVETLLRREGIPANQNVFIQKAFGGELCVDALDLSKLAAVVNGDYTVPAHRKLNVQLRVLLGAPTAPHDIVAAVRAGRPLIFLWRQHAYLINGVAFDEYVSANGSRFFEIRELGLLDPAAEGEDQQAAFIKGRDDMAEIDGTMELVVTPIREVDWSGTGPLK